MSTRIMALCWPLQMPPTPKGVLVSLADNANDHGECWPSIDTISERTCFGRTAVISAIAWLERAQAITADRSNGRHTRYQIHPDRITAATIEAANQSASRTGTPRGPVRQANGTSPPRGPDPSASRTAPVREADSNRQEPSRTTEATGKQRASAHPPVARPVDVTEQTWSDWLSLRKAKRAPVTETVLDHARSEAAKAQMPLERFLRVWCGRGSQGLEADWLKPHERAGPNDVPSKQLRGAQAILRATTDDRQDDPRALVHDPDRAMPREPLPAELGGVSGE